LYARIASPSQIKEYNRIIDYFEKLLPARGRLLDFACGAGYFFEQAQQRGWDAHGTDIGEWTKEAARARGLANLHVGRLADLSFPTHHFDLVYASQVLEHLPEPKADLAEIHRILRPGGLLYVDVPNFRTLPIMLRKDDFILNMPPQHINYFTPRTLRALLRTAGFSDVRLASCGGLKWENLLGRRIQTEITTAYGIDKSAGHCVQSANGKASQLSIARLAKKAIVTTLIKPVLYDRLKLGINLQGFAIR
jgi:SAM-dependent methyltransferase